MKATPTAPFVLMFVKTGLVFTIDTSGSVREWARSEGVENWFGYL